MPDEKEKTPQFEVEMQLPEHLPGPVTLPNGDSVCIGDRVKHADFGTGTVYRIATYHDELGVLLCVEFPSGIDKMLGLSFVEKVH